MSIIPVCYNCKNFIGKVPEKPNLICKAFPDKIPDTILIEGGKHKERIPGDNGIQFESIKE